MKDVYVVGSYSTQFKRWERESIKSLTRKAYLGALQDAAINADDIEVLWFSNASWGHSYPARENFPGIIGQMNVRGNVAFAPLVNEGLFPQRVPCINVEGACASGSLAFNGALKDVLSGQSQVALALGVEKLYYPAFSDLIMKVFVHGIDVEELAALEEKYQRLGTLTGKGWTLGKNRSLFMDIYAGLAAWHMWKWGTTREQLAVVASKNHFHGSLNPLAQYQFEVSTEEVLNDYEVSWPLTRSMCAPLGDGAAAAILCSEEYLQGLPSNVQKRAIKVLASVIGAGHNKEIDELSVSHWTAQKAYKMARIGPEDIDTAEVHDATAFSEIYQTEMLGFCPVGSGGKFVESGATRFDGKKPVNTSGGLESKGHPIGATGLSQINEIALQLRGEAGKRQVKGAEIGLVENGGGAVSFEEFTCAITILQKSDK